jgi:predicted small lipoprotein YifL
MIVVAAVLSGCGVKGPLRLPSAPPPAAGTPAADSSAVESSAGKADNPRKP